MRRIPPYYLSIQLLTGIASLVAQLAKNSPCNAGDPGSTPGSGRSSGEGNGNPPQHSCLGNPMDRGTWRATIHGVARVGHNLVTKPPPLPHEWCCCKWDFASKVTLVVKKTVCQCRRRQRCRFSPWVRKVPWRRKWQPTSEFLPGEFHGQGSLANCSPLESQKVGRG